jgi:hypothetical protein
LNRIFQLVSPVLLAWMGLSCEGDPGQTGPEPTPTETGEEPKVLPIDTAPYLPEDTAPDVVPNLTPDHYVYMSQVGNWSLSASDPPFTDLFGTLRITEHVDTLDTALPVYECNVTYSLTGSPVDDHTCADCDFVFDVEYFVTAGDPGACHDPDAPASGAVWQLGYDAATSKIYLNYYGTDVWLPWYDANKAGSTVNFDWTATLAIELEDSGDM